MPLKCWKSRPDSAAASMNHGSPGGVRAAGAVGAASGRSLESRAMASAARAITPTLRRRLFARYPTTKRGRTGPPPETDLEKVLEADVEDESVLRRSLELASGVSREPRAPDADHVLFIGDVGRLQP